MLRGRVRSLLLSEKDRIEQPLRAVFRLMQTTLGDGVRFLTMFLEEFTARLFANLLCVFRLRVRQTRGSFKILEAIDLLFLEMAGANENGARRAAFRKRNTGPKKKKRDRYFRHKG